MPVSRSPSRRCGLGWCLLLGDAEVTDGVADAACDITSGGPWGHLGWRRDALPVAARVSAVRATEDGWGNGRKVVGETGLFNGDRGVLHRSNVHLGWMWGWLARPGCGGQTDVFPAIVDTYRLFVCKFDARAGRCAGRPVKPEISRSA
ncbi:hypothetical protein FN846DRAFT_891429 [Sphaerosporella brunnea]|uniref:Uncharacterized protein n=1 Tax=Sphaerosporella brunnea TaxID=1250544 RepID=A0A5J5ETI2_9PEZI|nr:hypothetical protein FN846DRAFT_891429 [Sphaerosporella brunnea]